MDLILSSGFLGFARHLGAIDALLGNGVSIDAVVGTSSGALVGALFQAGVPLDEMGQLLAARPPIRYMRPHARPWEGLCSLNTLIPWLRRLLPVTFEALSRPFAVGVRDESGDHHLLHRGDLVAAVMASMAIPYVFPPVLCDGRRYADGGVADRTGVVAWRQWRPERHAVVHIIDRSRGRDVAFDAAHTTLVRTPRSRAKFWSLGDFEAQRSEAKQLVEQQLANASA